MKNIDFCFWLYCSLFLGILIKVNKNIKKKEKISNKGLEYSNKWLWRDYFWFFCNWFGVIVF